MTLCGPLQLEKLHPEYGPVPHYMFSPTAVNIVF